MTTTDQVPEVSDVQVPNYMREAVISPLFLCRRLVSKIKESSLEFDTIAVRGNSGLIIGPLLAELLGKNILIVNKEGVRSHYGKKIIFNMIPNRYIIVDDLVDSGRTVYEMVKAINEEILELMEFREEEKHVIQTNPSFYPKECADTILAEANALTNASVKFVGGVLYNDRIPGYVRYHEVFDNTHWLAINDGQVTEAIVKWNEERAILDREYIYGDDNS